MFDLMTWWTLVIVAQWIILTTAGVFTSYRRSQFRFRRILGWVLVVIATMIYVVGRNYLPNDPEGFASINWLLANVVGLVLYGTAWNVRRYNTPHPLA